MRKERAPWQAIVSITLSTRRHRRPAPEQYVKRHLVGHPRRSLIDITGFRSLTGSDLYAAAEGYLGETVGASEGHVNDGRGITSEVREGSDRRRGACRG